MRHSAFKPRSLTWLAGAMAARRQGATLLSLPTRRLGLTGSSQFDPAAFDRALREHGAHSVILLPQMLRATVNLELARNYRISLIDDAGKVLATSTLSEARPDAARYAAPIAVAFS